MIGVERLADWIGRDVLDPDGEKIGKLDEVFLDGEDPVVAEVKSGGLRRKAWLVPLDRATVGRDHLRVAHPAALVSDAPQRSGDHPPDDPTLRAVAAHFRLDLRGEGTLEGSKARAARLAAAEAAERRARELEEEARRQDEQARQSGRASEAASAAHERAAAEAEAARAAAERARRGG